MDENIQVGFMNNDGFRELEDARLSYFSKYSDAKLDEIYEVDINARDIIDKIREIRGASRSLFFRPIKGKLRVNKTKNIGSI